MKNIFHLLDIYKLLYFRNKINRLYNISINIFIIENRLNYPILLYFSTIEYDCF